MALTASCAVLLWLVFGRQSSKRFARLGNGLSKRLEPHCAAVSLYVAYYN